MGITVTVCVNSPGKSFLGVVLNPGMLLFLVVVIPSQTRILKRRLRNSQTGCSPVSAKMINSDVMMSLCAEACVEACAQIPPTTV